MELEAASSDNRQGKGAGIGLTPEGASEGIGSGDAEIVDYSWSEAEVKATSGRPGADIKGIDLGVAELGVRGGEVVHAKAVRREVTASRRPLRT